LLFEKIESSGLAHYSYIIGDQNEAIVIDPKRDIEDYFKKSTEMGFEIKYILETHRNEDYIIGSKNLAEKTNAEIWHADHQLDYQYGNAVKDEQNFKIGRLNVQAISTPGHTPNSFSYLLKDFSGEPLMIFTGDLIFAGDTGRVDLMGEEHMDKMAQQMYDSIFNKILPLGDGVIICPAHGAGSVCGDTIAEREFTTIGLEKKVNPNLQYIDQNDFVNNIKEKLERPPYFRKMEELNLTGTHSINNLPAPKSLNPKQFKDKLSDEEILVLDTRNELNYGAAHIPDSISIWQDGLASFAGWFLPYNKKILLVTPDQFPTKDLKILHRLGFDNIIGYLKGGLLQWHMAGYESNSIGMIKVQNLCRLLDKSNNYWILDVRSEDEIAEAGEIQDAHHIHITQLPDNLDKISKDKPIYIFCGSGLRSTTAASLLKQNGFENINVILGGLEGWSSTTCPIV